MTHFLEQGIVILGNIQAAKSHIENNDCGLAIEYTLTKVSSYLMVISERDLRANNPIICRE